MPVSIPLIQITPGGSLIGTGVTNVNTTATGNQVIDNILFQFITRNGQPLGRMERQLSGQTAPALHTMLNTHLGYTSQHRLTLQDTMRATVTPAGGQTVFGFYEHVTATLPNTLVGIGFKSDGGAADNWHSFVQDNPGMVGASTVRHSTDLGVKNSEVHRLSLEIDGPTQTITWRIDGVDVDSWQVPQGSPLDQMGTTAAMLKQGWASIVPNLGTGLTYLLSGAAPQMRLQIVT